MNIVSNTLGTADILSPPVIPDTEYYFISGAFKNEIKIVVNKTFPALNAYHKTLLFEYLINIIDTIAIKFHFDLDNKASYENQFRQNNYKDTIGLLFMLLPFIDDINGTKCKKLQSLDELYIAKKDNSNQDINVHEPKYEYTNLQYGRCNRNIPNKAIEINFSSEHLEHNYILLIDTIQTIAHKLYVNWINIRPISPEMATSANYKLFRLTQKLLKDKKIGIPNRNYQGLPINEIYNVLSNYLFHEIKNIKWLIYDVFIDKVPHKYLYFLNQLLEINNCSKNIGWNLLPKNEQNDFKNNLNKFMNAFIEEALDTNNNLSRNNVQYMATVLIFFFNKYYTDQTREKEGYISLDGDIEDDIEEDIGLSKITIWNYKKTASSIIKIPHHMYEFIRESLSELQMTWYGQYFLDYNEVTKLYELNNNPSSLYNKQTDTNFSIKNIYNFAKSFISYTNADKKFVQYPKFWNSLEDEDKMEILNRINMIDTKWFTISRYLMLAGYSRNEIYAKNRDILNGVHNSLAEILLDVLARGGLLSEFVPDAQLSDYSKLPQQVNERNSTIMRRLGETLMNNPENRGIRERFDNSFYFINNLKYKELEITYKVDNIVKTDKYLDILCNSRSRIGSWTYIYGTDWICQINFFHHYLNNRIIYVTGGTGVGKSTQVPKLLLYSMKMLDYKINGKIACTQPRVPPTVNNAKTISSQMGIPIETYNKSVDSNIVSNNYYVQYKHQKRGHIRSQKGLTLEILTDGTLEMKLKNYPLLKDTIDGNLTTKNIYDIIIVDEAHEHNKNMDLILTRMKYATYYNNSVKLVIISATMEDDEPVYRRYYREVNDNRMFPLNTFIKNNKIDRVNVDRRLHISPPGEVTQYKIDEIYPANFSAVEGKKDKTLDAINTLVTEILKSSTTGDILVFQPGENEIKNTVTLLNKTTPYNVIALPYFSSLSDAKKASIEDLDKFKIRIPKNIPFEEEFNEDEYTPVPPGTYKRVIIVGTNIAEASITISTLRYVIETGTQKTNIYNYKSRNSQLILTGISEQSRLQRKGRVGRVAPGTVYYLYPKGSKESNKTAFNIAIEDISDKLFEMLYDGPHDIAELNNSNDPNKNIVDNVSLYKNGLDVFIKEHYFIKDIFYEYLGNNIHYDYANNENMFICYKTGFDKKTLDDKYGKFYIVHPDELYFNRNILGNVVDLSVLGSQFASPTSVMRKNDIVLYNSEKMVAFWRMLEEYLFIERIDDSLAKSRFGINASKMKTELTLFNLQQLVSYVYSIKYNCDADMLKLLSMHVTCRTLSELVYTKDIVVNNKKRKYNTLVDSMGYYGNCSGDSQGLIKIANRIINFIQKELGAQNNLQMAFNLSEIARSLDNDKEQFIDGLRNGNYKNMDKNALFNFLQLYNTNKLALSNTINDTEEQMLILNDVYTEKYLNDIKNKKNEHKIAEWSVKNYLNYEKVINFYTNYCKILNDVNKYNSNISIIEDNYISTNANWFKQNIIGAIKANLMNEDDRIKISLMNGYGYNIVRNIANINNNNYYIRIFNPSIDSVMKINKLFQIKSKSSVKIPNTSFLYGKCVGLTLLYISSIQIDGDITINFIDNIDSKLISKIIPQFVPSINVYDIQLHENTIKSFLKSLLINKNDSESADILNVVVDKYIKTIEGIRTDLYNNIDKSYSNVYASQLGGGNIYNYSNEYIKELTNVLNYKYIRI